MVASLVVNKKNYKNTVIYVNVYIKKLALPTFNIYIHQYLNMRNLKNIIMSVVRVGIFFLQ